MPIIVYGLIDPVSPKEVRYVGYSEHPKRRMNGHLADARRWPTCNKSRPAARKGEWIYGLLSEGRKPDIKRLEELQDGDDPELRENYWIRRLMREGHRLASAMQLVDGKSGGMAVSIKSKEAIASLARLAHESRAAPRTVARAILEFQLTKNEDVFMRLIQHNFRLDENTDSLLAQLATAMGLSEADVVRQAIRLLARRELPETGQKKTRKKPENGIDSV